MTETSALVSLVLLLSSASSIMRMHYKSIRNFDSGALLAYWITSQKWLRIAKVFIFFTSLNFCGLILSTFDWIWSVPLTLSLLVLVIWQWQTEKSTTRIRMGLKENEAINQTELDAWYQSLFLTDLIIFVIAVFVITAGFFGPSYLSITNANGT